MGNVKEDEGRSSDPGKMTVDVAASSMISGSDVIPPEVFQANLAYIEEMKNIVRRLEANNQSAHQNYLLSQLEETVQKGREAQELPEKLKSQSQSIESKVSHQLSNQGLSEVVLPTTATVVEVQDDLNHPPSSAGINPPSTTSHRVPQPSYYVPPPAIGPPKTGTNPPLPPHLQHLSPNATYSSFQQVPSSQSPYGVPQYAYPAGFGRAYAAPQMTSSGIKLINPIPYYPQTSSLARPNPQLVTMNVQRQGSHAERATHQSQEQMRATRTASRPADIASNVSAHNHIHRRQGVPPSSSRHTLDVSSAAQTAVSFPEVLGDSKAHGVPSVAAQPPSSSRIHSPAVPNTITSQQSQHRTPQQTPTVSNQRNPLPEQWPVKMQQGFRCSQEEFIRGFKQSVESGIHAVAKFIIEATRAGVGSEYLASAIDAIPSKTWRPINDQLATVMRRMDQQPVARSPFTPPLSIAGTIKQSTQTAQTAPPKTHAQGTYPIPVKFVTPPAAISVQAAFPPAIIPPVAPTMIEQQGKTIMRTPHQADMSRLAQDILRALPSRKNPGLSQRKPEKVQGPSQLGTHSGVVPTEHPPSAATTVAPSTLRPQPSPAPVPCALKQDEMMLPPETKAVVSEPSTAQTSVNEGRLTIDLTLDQTEPEYAKGSAKQHGPSDGLPELSAKVEQTIPTPLPQDLSLDIHAQIEDVHMESPSSSQHLQEDHTQPTHNGSSETEPTKLPVATQEKPPSPQDRASEKLPLFLPSPPTSLTPDRSSAPLPPDTDDDVIPLTDVDDASSSRKRRSMEREPTKHGIEEPSQPTSRKKRRQEVYVLIPPPPPYLKRIMEKLKRKGWNTPVDVEVISESTDEGDVESALSYSQPEPFRYNQSEQEIIRVCSFRFVSRPCKWRGCDAILNCGDSLRLHLESHLRDDSEPVRCLWKKCRKIFHTDEHRRLHVRKHWMFPLPCCSEGCNEVFDKPNEVAHHQYQKHPGFSLPSQGRPVPFAASIPVKLSQSLHSLPSYRVIPRRIYRARISTERHAVVGPWVLWNIFGPVELNTRRHDITMREGSLRSGVPTEDWAKMDARNDEYDFLLSVSAAPSGLAPLGDLESSLVTQLAFQGLTLWAPEETEPSTVDPFAYAVDKVDVPAVKTITQLTEYAEQKRSMNATELQTPADADMEPHEEDAVKDMLIMNNEDLVTLDRVDS